MKRHDLPLPCAFHIKNRCSFGDSCRFSHISWGEALRNVKQMADGKDAVELNFLLEEWRRGNASKPFLARVEGN